MPNPAHLKEAIRWSRQKMGPFLDQRSNRLKKYLGKNYGSEGSALHQPVNLMELAVNIYQQNLAAQAPRALATTPYRTLKPKAYKLSLGLNHLIKEIDFEWTIQMAVLEGLLSMGIIKVGLNNTAQVEIGGYLHDYGQPFADLVTLDDFVCDMSAKKKEMWQFCGNRYSMLLEDAKQIYPKKYHDALASAIVDDAGDESKVRYQKIIHLWELWLPHDNKIVTMTESDKDVTGAVINEFEWEGPETGPYHILNYSDVPNQTIGLAPAATWEDLNELANKLFRKLSDQATRQKTILGVRAGGGADANRVIKCSDGDTINLDDPKNVSEFSFGGIDQTTLAFFLQVRDIYSYLAGNLDALGGLSAQSDTVGQDTLLTQSASQRMQRMTRQTANFTTKVIEDLGFYLWYDPMIVLPLVKPLPASGIEVPLSFGPADREGDYYEYNIKIEPYSMQHQSPAARLQSLRTVLAEMIMPLSQMMQQQGVTVDMQKLMDIVGRYGDLDELKEILIYSNPELYGQQQQPVQTPGGPTGTKPAQTTRRYERVNRPGATRSGKDQVLSQLMLGGNAQNSEKQALTRPTG